MAAMTGVSGFVIFTDTQTTLINKWTASFDRDIEDVSSFDDILNAKTKFGLMHKLTGTIEGFIDSAANPDIAAIQTENDSTGAACKLILSGGSGAGIGLRYDFTALLKGITLGVVKTGVQTFSATFESISAIAISS